MHTYCKLKSGKIVIIWSDNVDEETISAYPLEHEYFFDVEWDVLDTYSYSEIERTDTNLEYLQNITP